MAHPLVPLLVLVIVLLAAAAIGYIVLTIANEIADKTSKKMEKHNVSFTKDGMRVGVKEIKDEDYKSQTQRYARLCSQPCAVFGLPKRGRRSPWLEERRADWGMHSVLVKAWNLSTWPAYKSKLWNKEQEEKAHKSSAHASGSSRR